MLRDITNISNSSAKRERCSQAEIINKRGRISDEDVVVVDKPLVPLNLFDIGISRALNEYSEEYQKLLALTALAVVKTENADRDLSGLTVVKREDANQDFLDLAKVNSQVLDIENGDLEKSNDDRGKVNVPDLRGPRSHTVSEEEELHTLADPAATGDLPNIYDPDWLIDAACNEALDIHILSQKIIEEETEEIEDLICSQALVMHEQQQAMLHKAQQNECMFVSAAVEDLLDVQVAAVDEQIHDGVTRLHILLHDDQDGAPTIIEDGEPDETNEPDLDDSDNEFEAPIAHFIPPTMEDFSDESLEEKDDVPIVELDAGEMQVSNEAIHQDVNKKPTDSKIKESSKVHSASSKDPVGCRFRQIDPKEREHMKTGGERKSRHTEIWALNAFDEWRAFKGFGIEKSVADLYEEPNIEPLVRMLEDFFLELTKKDGTLYPPQSLQNMLRGIGRVMRARQEQRSRETMKPILIPFNIMKDPRFTTILDAGTQSVIHSSKYGLGREVKRPDILTREDEALMLQSDGASLKHPKGINNRFVYLACRNLFVRGKTELRTLFYNQFELRVDQQGEEYLRFMPGIAKNVKIDIKHCSYESLRKPIDCFCPDLVTTFKTMVSHWPIFTEEELHVKFKGEPQPLFLQPNLRYKSKDVVWFYKKPVGKNLLANVTRTH